MELSEKILKAKKDKDLRSVVVQNRHDNGKPVIRLTIEKPNNYNRDKHEIVVEDEAEIKLKSFQRDFTPTECSFVFMFVNSHDSVMKTFLKKIRKNSDVKFIARHGNRNQNTEEAGLHVYELIGVINGDHYLLDKTVMPHNTAAPIK